MQTETSPPGFHVRHATHRETLLKFLGLIVILVGYFAYMSWQYNAATGFGLAVLSWSFFVLCTPVADGGFILAFPIRLLFGISMTLTQVVIWFVAIAINLWTLWYHPSLYDLTFLTNLLKQILTQPYPYWSILLISALGTFLSIYFGDEMMDVTSHKHREKFHRHGFLYKVIAVVGLGVLTMLAYYHLLESLHIRLPT
ncbi:hypothetical protein A11A3_11117 [Alcanivorax hongdengensis A-11-3]|uniref:Uncharacterized protein n=1 Tax=Alcanivorax hongdengensis A-11-3 TaxID=1177179 RepID=L0WAY4_9GAMM|nr:hypothetical protein [Alcanivorax hongdengensis]EKF73903.1 hypothetical protein A11A3_11117 [Alcanivorax hongdengensis A-11-3]